MPWGSAVSTADLNRHTPNFHRLHTRHRTVGLEVWGEGMSDLRRWQQARLPPNHINSPLPGRSQSSASKHVGVTFASAWRPPGHFLRRASGPSLKQNLKKKNSFKSCHKVAAQGKKNSFNCKNKQRHTRSDALRTETWCQAPCDLEEGRSSSGCCFPLGSTRLTFWGFDLELL